MIFLAIIRSFVSNTEKHSLLLTYLAISKVQWISSFLAANYNVFQNRKNISPLPLRLSFILLATVKDMVAVEGT